MHNLRTFFVLGLCLVLSACFGDDRDSDAAVAQLAISGQVNLSNGTAANGAVLRIYAPDDSLLATTEAGANGRYNITVNAVDRYRIVAYLTQTGLPNATGAVFVLNDGSTQLQASVLTLPDLTQTVTVLKNGTAISPSGDVTISGFPDTVEQVFAQPYDPDLSSDLFPGDFIDEDDDVLNSAGFIWLSALDEDGNPVTEFNPAVTVRFRIPQAQLGDLLDLVPGNGTIDIPMYSFDESKGEWVRETAADGSPLGKLVDASGADISESDSASVIAGTFAGEVFVEFAASHFSWWNVDYAIYEDIFSKLADGKEISDAAGYPVIEHLPKLNSAIWLGDWVDAETSANFDDQDLYDDGLLRCDRSRIEVRANNLSESANDQIYVNVLLDDNMNSSFEASEWLIQNELYEVEYRYGLSKWLPVSYSGDKMLRIVVTEDPVTDATLAQSFTLGETEDYYDCPDFQLYTNAVGGYSSTRRLTESSTGLNCGNDSERCEVLLVEDQTYTVVASASNLPADSVQWVGNVTCADDSPDNSCRFTTTSETPRNIRLSARFPESGRLYVRVNKGSGLIFTDDSTVNCSSESGGPDRCVIDTQIGEQYVLKTEADSDFEFFDWRISSGPDCNEGLSSSVCTLDIIELFQSVRVRFDRKPQLILNPQLGGVINFGANVCDGSTDGDSGCVYPVSRGDSVSLQASANPGKVFRGWGGLCENESSDTCQVTIATDSTVSAFFDDSFVLSGAVTGLGGVSSSPAGINCREDSTSDCSEAYADRTVVTLQALADDGNVFTGWGGDCAGETGDECVLLMDAVHSFSAQFSTLYPLTVTVNGAGGSVGSDPFGIDDCVEEQNGQARCDEDFTDGTQVTLNATTFAGFEFDGWGGACATETGTSCTVTMDQAQSVTAGFSATQQMFSFNLSIDGQQGSVQSVGQEQPPKVSCSSADSPCNYSFAASDGFTLQGSADNPELHQVRWSGDVCNDLEDGQSCFVPMSNNTSVTATFVEIPDGFLLTVEVTNGGYIFAEDENLNRKIDCSPANSVNDCSAIFAPNEQVTLQVGQFSTGDPEFDFWLGDCVTQEDMPTCTLTMDSEKSVTARFVEGSGDQGGNF